MKASTLGFATRVKFAAGALLLCITAGTAAAEVVVVVSSTSAVTTLSRSQVTDIFLGRVSRFPNGAPAVPVDQEETSPARDAFYLNFAGKSQAQIKSHWSKIIFTGRGQPPRSLSNSDAVRKLVAANPQAIGYMERSQVDSSLRILATP